jgi:hypothetical protein
MSLVPLTRAAGSRSVVKVKADAVWVMRCWHREMASPKLSGHIGHFSIRAKGSRSSPAAEAWWEEEEVE